MIIDGLDYGPIGALVGTWAGDKGLDTSPEPVGEEKVVYRETIVFEAAGWVKNGGEQTLSIVRYHQSVNRVDTGEGFHDQVGYWTWDPADGTIAQSLTIPRAQALLAGGKASATDTVLEVSATAGDPVWGIAQSTFLTAKAKTTAYKHRSEISGDTLKYSQTTSLEIYGRAVEHTDESVLIRK
jgi:hypothetical protein